MFHAVVLSACAVSVWVGESSVFFWRVFVLNGRKLRGNPVRALRILR